MDSGLVQNFRRVKISNPGYHPLVQQGHLDFSATFPQPLGEFTRTNLQRVRPQCAHPGSTGQFCRPKQLNAPQPATIPVPDGRHIAANQTEVESQMLLARRIGQQDQPRHPRFKDNPIVTFQANGHALAESFDRNDPLANNLLSKDANRGANQDRPATTRDPIHPLDPAADNRQDPTPHRLDFG
jgi:hypothetical protein